MALIHTLRRSASRIVPLAARAFQPCPRYNSYHSSALFATVNRRSYLSSFRSFPSALRYFSSRPSSDEALIQFLGDEIKYAEDSDENINKAEELPPNFPFKLEDNPGQQTITLTREYQGEQIIIEVQMPSTVTGEEEENGDSGDDNADENGEHSPSQLPIVVRVSKSYGLCLEFGGPCLEFGCTAEPDQISIDSLSVKDPNSDEDQIAYEGPEFHQLDENLQKAFHKYLEIRGVKPSTTNFLHEYMLNKDSREYYMWLKNLKKFVEA